MRLLSSIAHGRWRPAVPVWIAGALTIAALAPRAGAQPQTSGDVQAAGSPDGTGSTGSTGAPKFAKPSSVAPPKPPAPTRFAAPARSQAGRAARKIARRVATFANYRGRVSHASWVVDPIARWSVRENRQCLADLRRLGIRVRRHPSNLVNPVPTPVELTGRVGGVWYRQTHEERTLLISCEMATRLPALSRVLRRQGVRGVDIMSAYRTKPRPSFHTMGLGLDLLRFWTPQGVLSVFNDFERTPEHQTCAAPTPRTAAGRKLRAIACGLFETRAFSTILTPNYNEGHRDHFHIDARPQDPRVFLR